MKPQSLLIAIVAGTTSVVLLAAGLAGTVLALPLMVLSPLPIAIAGLGWGSLAGLVAAIIGSSLLSVVFVGFSGVFFAIIIALPMAYLAHLIGLSRQDDPALPEEWFPVGDVLFRAIIIGGIVVGSVLIVSGFDISEVTAAAHSSFDDALKTLDPRARDAMLKAIDFQVRLTPYSMAMVWLLVVWLNLWLAIKVAKTSDRLRRPSFRLRDADLPLYTLALFGAGIVISFIPAPLGFAGAAFVGIIAMALIILGFNTLHVITARNPLRGMLLTFVYFGTILIGLPAIAIFLIGLLDLVFKLRNRYRAAHPD